MAGGEDLLFAGRGAIALVVLPGQAMLEEDTDRGVALGAPGLGLVGAEQVAGAGFGGVQDRVEGLWGESGQEKSRQRPSVQR
jgi:hypothetical protein